VEEIMAKLKLRVSAVAVALAVSGMASTAVAGGFGVGTQSGSGTGNAFAGGAAVADDASVAWSNPAAMTALPSGKQVTASGHIIVPSFKFTNGGSTGAFAAPGTGEGGDGGDLAVIPNMFYTMDIDPRLRFGFAVNVPFGLATEFDAGWRGQLTGLESSIKSINLNPSLAYKVSDTVSIGGGISLQKIEAKLSAFTGAPGVLTLDADDIGFGFNLGALFQLNPSTRIGITYRSQISYDLEGTAIFSAPAGAPGNGNVRADLKVPDSASWSILTSLNPQWELMADLTYTGWSSIKRLDVIRTSGPAAGTTLTSLLFNWKDTLRVGVGANYKMDNQTKLRFGLAFDPTPTNDIDRTPRLPDQDRTWAAFGVQYKPSKQGTLEVGYAHEFIKDASISATPNPAIGRLNGSFANKADILSLQYSHMF
jgi:long-chain fatty acid transport protein